MLHGYVLLVQQLQCEFTTTRCLLQLYNIMYVRLIYTATMFTATIYVHSVSLLPLDVYCNYIILCT